MKYIDADKLEDKLIEIEERHPAFCESVYDNACSNCLNEVRLIISSLLKEQISPLKGKFTFPKFLYARTTNNKTIDVSYAPQSLDAIEYVRNDYLQQDEKSGEHWQPCDEHFRALGYAIEYFKKKKNDTTHLEDLYNGLKKIS